MKTVFIKYNPYKLQTEITIEGKKLAENSKLGEKSSEGARLQEWIEELPQILFEEYNDTSFDITFHGTTLDYEDLSDVFKDIEEKENIKVKLTHIPAKETHHKEILIDKIFQNIKNGPFNELKDQQIIAAFENAKSSDFEICVVATMSAGKSTLINSMLGKKLMPSKLEACTAIITKIKDNSQENIPFKAKIYDRYNNLLETNEELTYSSMKRFNEEENVSLVSVEGNIPFVQSDDISLVLIDTPGPNNSRDENHERVQRELLGKSSKALVLYLMTGEYGTNDDNNLLRMVSSSMAVGGKQSKDRFIFVVNKLDERKKEDGDINETLGRVNEYLQSHGIKKPNLFPAAALPALNIRLMKNNEEIDEDEMDSTEYKVKKLNRYEDFHFENYAVLPPRVRGEVKAKLDKTRETGNGIDNMDEALIHTGIVSIEAAIRQYVNKYAKTAKIKNTVDTFMHKLEEVGCFEETKKEIAENQEEKEKIINQIDNIRAKIDSAKEGKKFEEKVNSRINDVNSKSKFILEEIVETLQKDIRKTLANNKNKTELNKEDAENEVDKLKKYAKELEKKFKVDVDELITKNLIDTSNVLLEEYKIKLQSLANEINLDKKTTINISPLSIMGGNFNESALNINSYKKSKEVQDGEEWVTNSDKKWFKPWTWFQESGYYRTTHKNIEVIDLSKLAYDYFDRIQDGLYENKENAYNYAIEQSKDIGEYFKKEFSNLDKILKDKLNELESYASDKEKVEERIKESERRLKWLEDIKVQVESILEI